EAARRSRFHLAAAARLRKLLDDPLVGNRLATGFARSQDDTMLLHSNTMRWHAPRPSFGLRRRATARSGGLPAGCPAGRPFLRTLPSPARSPRAPPPPRHCRG